jgi:hypothetical protein
VFILKALNQYHLGRDPNPGKHPKSRVFHKCTKLQTNFL